MDVSEYHEVRDLAFRMATTGNIIVHEGRVYMNVVLAAHASDKSALSFLPLLAGFVKSALPLSRSSALVARRYGIAPRAILISAPSID